jgi:hypothetical protein
MLRLPCSLLLYTLTEHKNMNYLILHTLKENIKKMFNTLNLSSYYM